MSFWRRLPPGVGWLFLSAAILVVNAIFLQAGGYRVLVNWGYFGGAVAIGIAIAFGEFLRHAKGPRGARLGSKALGRPSENLMN